MKPPRIIQQEMPFARRDVDVGQRMSVVDVPGTSGETVLLLHGNPVWSFLYRKLIGPLAADGHRVVVPDHIGHGLSDQPTDPGYYTLQQHIDNLGSMVEQLDLRDITLLVHDWGGPIGLGWAVRHPERVKRIIIANTTAFAPKRKRALSPFHKIMGSGPIVKLGHHVNLVGPVAMRFGVRDKLDRDVRAAYAWPLRTRGGRTAVAEMVQRVPNGPDHPSAKTLQAIQAGMPALADKPVDVWWADGDPVFPAWFAERWTKIFPHADVEHVSNAGHFWQEDDPEPVLSRLRARLAP